MRGASEDGSGPLAESAGARVVHESRRGYGSAYLAGLAVARGKYLVMLDADLTYDFREIPRFVGELEPRLERAFHYGMYRFYRRHYAPRRNPLANAAVYCGIAAKLSVALAGNALHARRSGSR